MSEAKVSQLEKKLWKLHRQLIHYYLTLLKREKGETLKGSLVDSIRQFLKDNGVYQSNRKPKEGLEQLLIASKVSEADSKVSEADSKKQDSRGIVLEYQDDDYFNPEGSSSRNTGDDEENEEFTVKH